MNLARSSVDTLSHELVRKYTAQPLKFAYYEHIIATHPMRQSRRSTNANRVLILLIIFASLLLFFYRWDRSFTNVDKACIQDEWIENSFGNSTKDMGDSYRVSFADYQQEYKWLYLPPISPSQILMMVISNCDNFARRNAIRRTWMNGEKNKIVAEGRLKALFLVGINGKNLNIDRIVMEEAKLFGDMVVVGLEDSYQMLPVKTFTALLYVLNKAPSTKLIGKIDEDVLFFPDQLLPLLEKDTILYNSTTVYGARYDAGIKVNHVEDGNKWYVPISSFKCSLYPAYLAGPVYFSTRKAAQRIVESTQHRNYITVEDVLITGLLAGDVGVEKIHLPMIYQLTASTPHKHKRQIMAWHHLTSNLQYEEEFEEYRETLCSPCLQS